MASKNPWPARLVVAGCALAVYAMLPGNPLLHDAPIAIERNAAVQEGSLAGLFGVDFWGATLDAPYASGSYRPLVSLTFALEARLLGNAAWSFHVIDMLLHALCAVLVLALGRRLGADARHAFLGALLYAVHPLVTDAVCSVVGRADLMAAAALLGALLLRATGGGARDIAAALCLAAALLSKEYAVAFPFVVIIADIVAGRGNRRETRIFWAVSGAILAGYLGLRFALIGSLGGVGMLGATDHPLYAAPLDVRWAMALRVGLLALRLLVLPWPLNHFYRYGTLEIVDGLAAPGALAGLAALLLGSGLAVWAYKRRHEGLPLVAWSLVVLPLAPSLNTVALSGVVFAERFMVLPVAGLALFVGWGLGRMRPPTARVTTVVLGLAIVVCGIGTFTRVRDWSSAERLARSSLAAYPQGAEVWEELGIALAAHGRDEEAVEAFARSVELRDHDPQTWMNYALSLGRIGALEEAAAAWRRTVELSPPELGRLWLGLGQAEWRAGNLDAAVAALERAAALMPLDRAAQDALTRARSAQASTLRERYAAAIAADAAGRYEEAIALYREILAIEPDHPPTLFNLGRALVNAGRPDEAIAPLRHGLTLRDEPRARALLEQLQQRR